MTSKSDEANIALDRISLLLETWKSDALGEISKYQINEEEFDFLSDNQAFWFKKVRAGISDTEKALDIALDTISYLAFNNPLSDQSHRKIEATFNEVRQLIKPLGDKR